MRMVARFRMACRLLAVLAASAPSGSIAQAVPASSPAARLGGAAQIEVRNLVAEYSRNNVPDARREEIVRNVLRHGPEAARMLLPAIERVLAEEVQTYRESFETAAQAALNLRGSSSTTIRSAMSREVPALRRQVASLRSGALTRDQIVSEGAPALARLREILLIPPRDVLSSTPPLADHRNRVLRAGNRRLACLRVLDGGEAEANRQKEAWGTYLDSVDIISAAQSVVTRSARRILDRNLEALDQIDPLEALGILDLNIMRLLLDLSALEIDVRLCEAARDHSHDMRVHRFFAHVSPVPGKRTHADRSRRFGTTSRSENIAFGRISPTETNMQWFHSPGHHRNMLNPAWSAMGLGRSEAHWTQLFR